MATQSPYISKSRTAHGEGCLDRETKIWSQPDGFVSVTLQAAVHLGKGYVENLRSTKNQPKKSRQLFQVTDRFITDQREITGLTTMNWKQPMWRETTLLTEKVVQCASATSGRYQY